MKKLIVAAAIVCAAALSQAATFKWTVEDVMASDKSGNYGENYLVLFMESAVTSYADASKNLGTGNTSFLSGSRWNDVTDEEGYLVMSKLKNASGSEYGAGDTVQGYLVILDSDSIGGAKNYIITDEISKTFPDNGAGVTAGFGSQASASWSALSSSPDPIPEPTSGLLLVLGMAGLALRRKQK